MRVEFRPATLKDVEDYGGNLPPLACRIWAGLIDGKVVAIGGFAYHKSGAVIAFLDADPEVRTKAKFSLMKAARHVLAEARKRGVREIAAEATASVEKSQAFLERLGFTVIDPDLRIYRNVLPD